MGLRAIQIHRNYLESAIGLHKIREYEDNGNIELENFTFSYFIFKTEGYREKSKCFQFRIMRSFFYVRSLLFTGLYVISVEPAHPISRHK